MDRVWHDYDLSFLISISSLPKFSPLLQAARIVKARIELTTLGDVTDYIEEVANLEGGYSEHIAL